MRDDFDHCFSLRQLAREEKQRGIGKAVSWKRGARRKGIPLPIGDFHPGAGMS